MSGRCRNCENPVQIELPEMYGITLCLRCGLFMIAAFRLRAEFKGPGAVAAIESVLLRVEQDHPERNVRDTVHNLTEGLRDDPKWQQTMDRMRERHEEHEEQHEEQ